MRFSTQHEAAKKSFSDVTQSLEELGKLESEYDYVIDYFERLEADILQEKETKQKELNAYYKKLVESVHERKVKCLRNVKTKKSLASEIVAFKQKLPEFGTKEQHRFHAQDAQGRRG